MRLTMKTIVGLATLCTLGFSNQALAQIDVEEVAGPCLADLERAAESITDDDSGVAMVLLDMAQDSCRTARDTLVESTGEDDADRDIALTALWQMELRRVELLALLESCDDSREVLQAVSTEVELPPTMATDFARVAYQAMRCGPSPGSATGEAIYADLYMYDQYFSGYVTGEQDASTFGSHCWGWVPYSPAHLLEVSESMYLSLSVWGTSDLVLVVTGPGGTFCNDDWDGVNPALGEYFSAGTYEVYIGEYSSSGYGSDYSLTVSTSSLVTPYTYTYPTYGSASVGSGYGRTTLSGSAWGVRDASVAYDPTCPGWVADESSPDFELWVDYGSDVWINVTGTAGADLTLVVDGPGGRYCNDDTNGLNPAIHEAMPSGTYNVWVGDKSGPSSGASYGIQFSSYDPMIVLDTEPAHGTVEMAVATEPQTLTGSVEGIIPAADFYGSSCWGNIDAAPSHSLVVTEGAMVEIVTRTTGYENLLLAVSGPSGTYCNDDYEGLNPGVRRWLDPGEYLISVAVSYPPGYPINFTTTISSEEGTPPPDLETLTSGLFGDATVGSYFGTTTLSGTSGGPNRADDFEYSCRGYISELPSYILNIEDYNYVQINVLAEGDTTLVVMGPDGVFCNDDYTGLNPGLYQYLSPGRYGVWVGSYSADQANQFMISFSGDYY